MNNNPQKVIYVKPSRMGIGKIPVNTEGKVLIYSKHPITTKLLVDFYQNGKAIVPLSSVKRVED